MTLLYGGRFTLGSVLKHKGYSGLPAMEPTGKRLLKTGEIARLAGVGVGTILNYEQQRLLKPLTRSAAGHRLYGQEEVARVQFIRQAKLAGLTLAEARELLTLVAESEQGENIPRLKEALEEKLQQTEQKMEELVAFRDSLLHYRRQFEQRGNEG